MMSPNSLLTLFDNIARYRKMEWKNILVGDFVHLSHDEIIPADILLLK